MLHGQCVLMETLTRQESWTPNLADSTRAGSVTLQTQRTAYGIVIARATIKGKPVAYTNLRSTYVHELDSAAGFQQFNDPSQMNNPQDFFNAASKIDYTFNWFYAEDKHTAYINSGRRPRHPGHLAPGLGLGRGLLRDRPEGSAGGPASEGARAAQPDLLRQRLAGQVPRGTGRLARCRRGRVPAAGLPGRQRLPGGRPDVF
jgi:hypothetical protein